MKARWLFALALAIVAAVWFFWNSGKPHPAVKLSADSQPTPTVSLPFEPEVPAPTANRSEAQPIVSEVSGIAQSQASDTSKLDPIQTSAMLYGFVPPAEASKDLEVPLTVIATDHLGERHRAETGWKGEYSFPMLTSGRHWIAVQSRAFGEVRKVIDLDASAGDRRLDLQLNPPRDILVEVTDPGGESIQGVALLAVATIAAPGEWLDVLPGSPSTSFGLGVWTRNGNDGVDFQSPVCGRLRLSMSPPLYVSILHWQRVIATQRIEPDQSRVRFILDPRATLMQRSKLRLRLIDAETRQPIETTLQFTQHAMLLAKTGADGVFSGSFLPGWLGVKSLDSGLQSPDLLVRLEPGVERDLGDIVRDTSISISGKVVDELGQGVKGRLFHEVIDATSGKTVISGMRYSVFSKEDGSFRIEGLSRNRYSLQVQAQDNEFAAQRVEVDTRAGLIDDLRIGISHGTPLIVCGSDERWPIVRFEVFDAQGTRQLSSPLYGPEPRKFLLAPGRYEVEVQIGGVSEIPRRTIDIVKDPVELILP